MLKSFGRAILVPGAVVAMLAFGGMTANFASAAQLAPQAQAAATHHQAHAPVAVMAMTGPNAERATIKWMRNNCGDLTHWCMAKVYGWPSCYLGSWFAKKHHGQWECDGEQEQQYLLPPFGDNYWTVVLVWDQWGHLRYHRRAQE